MSDSQLSMNFWAEAMYSSAHIKNRIKSSVHGMTLYELWYRRRPNIKYMKRFGCIAYILNKERLRNKLLHDNARPHSVCDKWINMHINGKFIIPNEVLLCLVRTRTYIRVKQLNKARRTSYDKIRIAARSAKTQKFYS
ncbi:hypothetical protein WN55_05351 [Dufourea novaeangliae]|uniref:Copia protein n=1 Tax=Dufourea novaeangliae TaxID=178035 RepID=A0A154PMN7_DUFNO|nr:hypothetical protein WN55_05351 [Dufourea novaeangliae]